MFRNLRLSKKMILGFALVLIVSTVVTGSAIFYMGRIADTTDTMFNYSYTAHVNALEAQANINAMARDMKDVVLTPDKNLRNSYYENIDQLEQQVLQNFDVLYERYLGDHSLLDAALQAFKDWKPIRDEVIYYIELGQQERAANVSRSMGNAQIELVESSIQKVVDDTRVRAEDFNASASDSAASATLTVLGLLVTAYVVAIVAAVVITRSITRPVSLLLSFTQEIAAGNLGVSDVAYQSRDEIGELTAALNKMKSELRDMVTAVKDSVSTVRFSAEQISSGAQETSASVEELARSANEFAGAVDRLNFNTQQIAELAEKTNEMSRQGSVEIEQTVRIMNEIHNVVTELAAEIKDLGRQSEEIGNIVSIITGIADQTNLLALNAAIEAARAGEQGRGFAVVADEVRELAEQSAQAAGDITKLIKRTMDSVNLSVERTDLGAGKVKEGMDIVTRTGNMFAEIAEVIKSLTHDIGEIATASEELSAGAEEIGATTEQQSASTEQMAASTVEVVHAAEAVDQQMSRFKL